jgi:hypothetical protein
MREDCLKSLYVFAKVVCGFGRFKKPLHKDMCDFLQNDPSLRKLLMAPRDHYKSSVMMAYLLWRICKNPEERILLAGDTALGSEKKLLKIRQFIEKSEQLRALFPEIVPPDTSKVQWSSGALTVVRKGAHAEPTITAQGTEGARAGAHYTLIICDDVATKEAKDQPSTMKKIVDWMDGTEALLELPYEQQIIVIGTFWAHDDVYEHIRKSWGSAKIPNFYKELIYSFFDEEGEPIFSELYGGRDNAMDFARRMAETNPYLWSANFLNSPQIPDAQFNESDLQYFELSPDREYILYKGFGMDQPNVMPVSSLEVYITVDPAFSKDATASKAAICVSGVSPDGHIFVLESAGVRSGTDKLIDKICEFCFAYEGQLRKVGIEKVGQQQAFIDYLNKEFRRRGIYRRVEPLPPGSTKSKEARIRANLQPYFSQRRLWLRVNQSGLLEEFRKFPLSSMRDELDAMSYAAAYFWQTAGTKNNVKYDDYTRQFEAMRDDASQVTGY